MHVRIILLLATALVVPIAHAQSTVMSIPDPAPAMQPAASDTKQITFDVVSIKQNKSDSMGGSARSSPDGVTFVNTTLLFQIAPAYGVEIDEVSGLPDWAKDNHYDIQYKVAAEDIVAYRKLPRAESQRMTQAVLEDRLKLKVHFGTKEVPMYQLVIAKGGPKLHEAKPGDTYANGMKAPDGTPITGSGMRMGRGMLTGQQISVSSILNSLKAATGRDVIDKTGLTGKYDIDLHWTPDSLSASETASTDASGPDIFTALQEQLGLKLEPTKGDVKTLIIDHIEPPTPN